MHLDLHFNVYLRKCLRSTDVCSLDPVKFPRQVDKWMKSGRATFILQGKACTKCFEKVALGRVALKQEGRGQGIA